MIYGAHVSIAGGVAYAPLHANTIGDVAMQIFTNHQNRSRSKPNETI